MPLHPSPWEPLPGPALAAVTVALDAPGRAALRCVSRASRAAVDALLPSVAVYVAVDSLPHDPSQGVRPDAAGELPRRFPNAAQLTLCFQEEEYVCNSSEKAAATAWRTFTRHLCRLPPGAWQQFTAVECVSAEKDQTLLLPTTALAALVRAAPRLVEVANISSTEDSMLRALVPLAPTLTTLTMDLVEWLGFKDWTGKRRPADGRRARGRAASAALAALAGLTRLSLGDCWGAFPHPVLQAALPVLARLEELSLGVYDKMQGSLMVPLQACTALRQLAVAYRPADSDHFWNDVKALVHAGGSLGSVTSLQMWRVVVEDDE
jgi:hypothetical protein